MVVHPIAVGEEGYDDGTYDEEVKGIEIYLTGPTDRKEEVEEKIDLEGEGGMTFCQVVEVVPWDEGAEGVA